MFITFTCPECKAELEIDARMAGAQSPCPQCGKSMILPRREPGPGVTIGQFQIQKFISKGGMGEVFLARQLSLGRDVALKILPAHLRGQKMRVQRFLKEVQTLARLDHPNIVIAYEAGDDEGILYLAMSYVPGDSLEQRLSDTGPMAEIDALKLLAKLAGALDYAWREHHLLHRDIKPANILFTAGGEVKLTDFGLAKCLDDATELTMSGDIIGSPNYMSPEQVSNCLDLDCRSDMYSMGATLYHMLTGKLPFGGSSLMETLKKQITESLPDPRIELPAISEACVTLLEIMLAKDRNDRHPDYSALQADIARVIAGEQPIKNALRPGESVLMRAITEQAPHRPQTPPVAFARPRPGEALCGKPQGFLAEKGEKGDKHLKRAAAVMLALAVAVLLAVALARSSGRKAHKPSPPVMSPAVVTTTTPPAAEAKAQPAPAENIENTQLRDKFLDVLKYAREHPDDYAGSLERLEALRQECKGTDWEEKIAHEIERTHRLRQFASHRDLKSLRADIQALLAQNDFDGALKRIETDKGIGANETNPARADLIREVIARKQMAEDTKARERAESEKAKQAETDAKLAALAEELAGDLLKSNLALLQQRLSTRLNAGPEIISSRERDLIDLALQVAGWTEHVARSFEKSRGKPVTVQMKGGKDEAFTVTGIASDRVRGQVRLGSGFLEREFFFSELSVPEKLKRIEDVPPPAGKIMRGLIMVRQANDWDAASKEFAQTGLLSEALLCLAPVPAGSSAEKPITDKEGPARQALQDLLKLCDVSSELSNAQALADIIRSREYSPSTAAKIKSSLDDFNRNYTQTETAKEYAPVIHALGSIGNYIPPLQRPMKPRWRRGESLPAGHGYQSMPGQSEHVPTR